MKTVEDWFDWRTCKKSKSIEDQNYDNNTISKSWKHRDVLYSFLGIYSIGLWIFYPSEYTKTTYTIRPIDMPKSNKVSFEYLNAQKKYSTYNELNNFAELKMFIEYYDHPGNVIPVWPGANIARGMSYCFDIPDIYFRKNDNLEWTKILIKKYNDIYLDDIMNCVKYPTNTKEFLEKIDKNGYKNFLMHCVSVISNRDKKLKFS